MCGTGLLVEHVNTKCFFPHEGKVLPPSPSSSPPRVECIGMLKLTGDSCLVKASITRMLWLCYEVGIEEAMIELGT